MKQVHPKPSQHVLPTFIIGGAPRAGTSYLYRLLDAHPDIFMAKPLAPEPKFFLVDDEYRRGLSYYSARYFSEAANYVAVGEKSTNYLENPIAAKRIGQSLPSVKIIFSLRDPVERAFSNYLWSRKNGLEPLGFDEALRRESEREENYDESLRYARPFSYMSRGMYAELLQPFFRFLGREQIKIIMFERIKNDPKTLVNELCEFIGVAPQEIDFDFSKRINVSSDQIERMSDDSRAYLHKIFARPNQDLAKALGVYLHGWGE